MDKNFTNNNLTSDLNILKADQQLLLSVGYQDKNAYTLRNWLNKILIIRN